MLERAQVHEEAAKRHRYGGQRQNGETVSHSTAKGCAALMHGVR